MLYQKGFVATMAIILVVVALVVVGYLIYQKSLTPTNVSKQTTTSLDNIEQNADQYPKWKIYTDTNYGFSFQYPDHWIESKKEGLTIIEEDEKSPLQRQGVQVKVYENIGDMDAREYLEKIYYDNADEGTKKLTDVYIKNNEYAPIKTIDITATQFDLRQPTGSRGTAVWINKNGVGILLTFNSVEGQKELINPILSTFKFLNQETFGEQETMEFNGRTLQIERVGEGSYCQGRVGSTQTTYSKCKIGLICKFTPGSAQDAPGICVKE